MKQKSNKLTKYYTKALLDAYDAGAVDQWEILRERPEIDWMYCYKGRHIVNECAFAGDAQSLRKIFELNDSIEPEEFLQVVCNAARSGRVECVKLIIENIDNFGGIDDDYFYNITSALRTAGEINDFDSFDYLVSLGAMPNDWWVIYWTTKKSNKKMYEKLMIETLKLKVAPSRKFVIAVCEKKENEWKNIDTSLLIEK